MREKLSLGQFISTRRKHMRLTQEELADQVGVSKSAIAKWETDGGLPDRDNLRRISEVMDVSVDELHRIIEQPEANHKDFFDVNITLEVIKALESYGYKVIRPGEEV
ncbi:MAG: helix-turn-helix domain-containing protein [Eubacterium sp.]|jgi:transcriptional regulator with XRE-family HTH domain|nr:helix-turn-helix domain-containing protein [Eubacterium sp.]